MTDPAVTMSGQMNESDSPVGGVPSADPLTSAPDPVAADSDVEIVDGLPVLAEVRTVERVAPAPLPTVQVAAVAATGFVAGAATVALVKRRAARKVARSGRGGPRRAVDLLPIAASRSFLVDVHVIGKQGD
ncbi:MAG: hypothetical protein JO027_10670 [Solirubrobacterales bacterium]|nr:hypothetical protein [Solirubrobacterales bacterium]